MGDGRQLASWVESHNPLATVSTQQLRCMS
eukprot:COSAG06_NODE_10042_length_1763_cov_1.862981_1_plen_29_part_10